MFYDFILTDLAKDFEFRFDGNLDYSEEEVWKIIEGTINGLKFLYDNGMSHESVRMDTIYLTQQDTVKVADPLLFGYKNDYVSIFRDRDRFS
jgi:hypothetical protein